MRIAITGHRPDKLFPRGWKDYDNNFQLLISYYEKTLPQLLSKDKPDENAVISGMAVGCDQAAAIAAINLGIPVIACVPFLGQELIWSRSNQELYHWILERSQEVKILYNQQPDTKAKAAFLLNKRNEYMVDNADMVLAMWNGTPGGTGNCIGYARAKGIPLGNIWNDWNGPWRDFLR